MIIKLKKEINKFLELKIVFENKEKLDHKFLFYQKIICYLFIINSL